MSSERPTRSRVDGGGRLLRWAGPVIAAVAAVALLWLLATGRLGLYIHPRYFVFTAAMAVVVLLMLVLSVLVGIRSEHEHEHEHEHGRDSDHGHDPGQGEGHGPDPRRAAGTVDGRDRSGRRRPRRFGVRREVLVLALTGAVVALGLIVFPPQALSPEAVQKRDLAQGSLSADAVAPAGGDTADYSVKQWWGLMRTGDPTQTMAGLPADLIGFVVADTQDPDNVFLLTRYVVTCCAVDAQPVGLPVYSPGWRQSLTEHDWVQVAGTFRINPSTSSYDPVAIVPEQITAVEEPDQPYDY